MVAFVRLHSSGSSPHVEILDHNSVTSDTHRLLINIKSLQLGYALSLNNVKTKAICICKPARFSTVQNLSMCQIDCFIYLSCDLCWFGILTESLYVVMHPALTGIGLY